MKCVRVAFTINLGLSLACNLFSPVNIFSLTFRRRSRIITALLTIAVEAAILSTLVTVSLYIPRQMGGMIRMAQFPILR